MPELSVLALSFLCRGYGILLFLMLLSFLPHRRRFFLSERWGGYGESSPTVDAFQNPIIYPFLFGGWFLAAICIAAGVWSVWAALVNLILCRYFFIQMRWKSLCRGMGAPGYITYWLGACIFFLEFTSHYVPYLQSLALMAMQIDFAVIFFLSGVYKYKSGYRSGQGMELGEVNPQWGYWWRWVQKSNPNHVLHRANNTLAWVLEMLTAALMVMPGLRFAGGFLLIMSFLYIASLIRLGLLPEMVMLIGLLYFTKGSPMDQWMQSLLSALPTSTAPQINFSPTALTALHHAIWGYLALLPFAYGGLCYNFYGKKSLPKSLQWTLERYTNFFGMILWRVFSADVTNFFIRIYRTSGTSSREIVSEWGWNKNMRWGHVCEAITMTCIFTSLKYFASNRKIFEQKLVRYARTIPCGAHERLIFEYVSIEKGPTEFLFCPLREFVVFPITGEIREIALKESKELSLAAAGSPIHETDRPGTYAPTTPATKNNYVWNLRNFWSK